MPKGAAADQRHRLADAVKLGFLGEMAGDKSPRIGLVRIGARGREAERAGALRRLGQAAHLDSVVRRRNFAIDAAFARHEPPQRVMRDLRADIDRTRHPVERTERFGKAFPITVQALRERSAGNVFDRLHQIDQSARCSWRTDAKPMFSSVQP
jgi:hypothetical protein